MMSDKLKPCPCGMDCDTSIRKERHASDYTEWWVEAECGWRSKSRKSREKAVAEWNNRPDYKEKLKEAVEIIKDSVNRSVTALNMGVKSHPAGHLIDCDWKEKCSFLSTIKEPK